MPDLDQQIIDRLMASGFDISNFDSNHPAIKSVLDLVKSDPGLIADAARDYARTYTRAEYTMYDRTRTDGLGTNTVDNLVRGPEIQDLLSRYGIVRGQ